MHADRIGTSASASAPASLRCTAANSSGLAALLQALGKALQRPDIVRMLRTTLDSAAQAEIVAVDLLGLAVVALFGKQGRQRMPRRMHPGPRLDVFQVVVPIDGFPQMGIAAFMIAFVIFEFAVQHLLAHRQDAARAVVENLSLARECAQAVVKQLALLLGLVELLERGMRDALGVVLHRGRNRIQLRIIRQRRVDDLLPASEPHHHVHRHRVVAFQAGGESGAALDAENLLRQQAAQLVRRSDRVGVSAHEHAGMHHQQQIVRAGRRVGRERPGVVEILVVGGDRPGAGGLAFW